MQTLHTVCVALRHHIDLPSSELDLFWSVCLNPSKHVQGLHSENLEDTISSSPAHVSHFSADEIHSLCDLLVNYVHRDGSLLWLSRDSLLLLVASSSSNEGAGYHIANNSNLCEVLATDMVVLFTDIPRQLIDGNSIDDWPKLLSEVDVQMLKDHPLDKFLDHYEFCCSIMDLSNYMVKENMLTCLYKGFLLPVIGPEIQSVSRPELATATMYLEQILLKSKESKLLPFLLRFLFSDRNATHSDVFASHSFKHEITQALEQSFPLSEFSSFLGSNGFVPAANGNSYMDLFLRRIEASNTLAGIATLSLMNTILDLLCEDVMFELILKYLLSEPHTEVGQLVTNPSSLISSSGKYLALIPPYSSPSLRPNNASEAIRWESSQNGDLSSFRINQSTMANLVTESDLEVIECQRLRNNRMQNCLLEVRKLIAERKAACGDWRFPYDLGNPSPSIVPFAHINGNLLGPLPQSGLQNIRACDTTVNPSGNVSSSTDRNQWEFDGFTQMATEDDSILADLERFSALLRAPTVSTPSFTRKVGANNCKLTSGKRRRLHRQRVKKESTHLEDIKRTSSLYDITYVDIDSDEFAESGENSLHPQADRMIQSTLIRRVSISSTNSATSQQSMELSLTESSEKIPPGLEEITRKGGVSDLMIYLDRIPGENCVYTKSVESRFEAFMRKFDEKNQELELSGNCSEFKGGDVLRGVDSGFASVDSALMKTSSSGLKSLSNEAVSFYPGPFLTAILKLVNEMPSNYLYTNLQVTRLVTHLMALPLSIVRLQLLPLSSQETHSPNAYPNLYTTLKAVRQRFDCYVNLHFSVPLNPSTESAVTFASLVEGLRKTVFPQGKNQAVSHAYRPSVMKSSKRLSWLISRLRLSSLKSALTPSLSSQSSTGSSPTRASGKINCDHEWRTLAMHHLGGIASSSSSNLVPLKTVKDEKSGNIIMALFVFEEFCRELSALCLEHSVAL
ncbi:unnamed protein product [Rodentolepis nana]|uniref:FHF complex subunit HOOK-interacting protein C-terminal domain-containing protein n=1 Tax=Rodentolepis nana TaxID=102285 RepID=A0A3P7T803_RODNA|nr:unnamed protein product [Rodentolepis nana]